GLNNVSVSSITAILSLLSSEKKSAMLWKFTALITNKSIRAVVIIKVLVLTLFEYVWDRIIQNLFIRNTNLLNEYIVQCMFFMFKLTNKSYVLQFSENLL